MIKYTLFCSVNNKNLSYATNISQTFYLVLYKHLRFIIVNTDNFSSTSTSHIQTTLTNCQETD